MARKYSNIVLPAYPLDKLPEDYVLPEKPVTAVKSGKADAFGKQGRRAHGIDWPLTAELLKIQCTQSEIADVLGCNIEVLIQRCPLIFGIPWEQWSKHYSSGGKTSLRHAMYTKATDAGGDTPMLKHLSEHYLGMKHEETADNQHGNATRVTISFADVKAALAAGSAIPVAPAPKTVSKISKQVTMKIKEKEHDE